MYHNNFDLTYKNPFGAVKEGTDVYFRLDVDKPYRSCKLRLWTPSHNEIKYDMNFDPINNRYETNVKIYERGINWYFFVLEEIDGTQTYYCAKNGYTAGEGQQMNNFPYENSFQITCYKKEFEVPEWFKGKIMYQIFPDRFYRDTDYKFDKVRYKIFHENWTDHLGCTKWGADNFEFYGGNIRGIMKKIDYIKKLGVGIIYLNPIFKAKSNHRYDVSTFMEMDEMLGLQSDFKDFVELCHQNNIKVILDVSWNHTGDDSIYFNKYGTFGLDGAYNNPNSNYRSWYNIYENGQYDCWWGFDSLPVVNKYDTSYKIHVQQVVKHWINDMKIDGFRLDVIDELPDSFLKWFRDIVKAENKDAAIFGETWEDASLKKNSDGKLRAFLHGHSQDTVMNYVLRNIIVSFLSYGAGEKEVYHTNMNGNEFCDRCMNLFNNYPKESIYCAMNFLSTHDINRILTILSDTPWVDSMTKEQQGGYKIPQKNYELGVKRFKLAWSLICFLPGNPSLFYGDEAGMSGYNDPYNRKPMKWNHIDNNLLNWTQNTNKFRNSNELLKSGNFKLIKISEDIVGVERFNEKDNILLFINRSQEDKEFKHKNKNIHLNGLNSIILENIY